jgi:hypothetical protein
MTFSTEFFKKFYGLICPGKHAGLNYGLRIMLVLVGFFARRWNGVVSLSRAPCGGKKYAGNDGCSTALCDIYPGYTFFGFTDGSPPRNRSDPFSREAGSMQLQPDMTSAY